MGNKGEKWYCLYVTSKSVNNTVLTEPKIHNPLPAICSIESIIQYLFTMHQLSSGDQVLLPRVHHRITLAYLIYMNKTGYGHKVIKYWIPPESKWNSKAMKCQFSTTFEFQPKQIHYEIAYFRPNPIVEIIK